MVLLKLNNYLKFKRLLKRLRKNNGRNFTGHITMKYKGGGNFYLYRKIDFFHYKYNFIYNLIGYDKSFFSTALLLLIKSNNGIYKYIIAPNNINFNKSIKITFFFQDSNFNLGDIIPVGWIPNNILIYNIEIKPSGGSKLVRAAGTFGKILSHSQKNVKILLPSKKKKIFSKFCLASIGRVSNIFSKFQNYGKAGYNINNNKRPRVNGTKMNCVDHPNGGKTRRGNPIKNFLGKIIK